MQERWDSGSTARTKAQRYREIAGVLARHGIGVVGEHRAEHLRAACEELGPTFIKLGQALSTRADLLPDEYRSELAKLQDSAAPAPARAIVDAIRDALGAAPGELFAFFDTEPLGSASIGQVHAARLADGTEVVVKVRKPGVDRVVEMDLEILGDLIDAWSGRFPLLEEYDARGLLREFGDTLHDELDYEREAANLRRYRDIFAKQRGIVLPDIADEYSSASVITLTHLDGRKPSDLEGFTKRQRASLSRRISRFVLEPAFEHGLFYADPHGGNFLVRGDGALEVIDFGMIGRLTPDARRRVADIFVAMNRRDAQRLCDRLVELAAPSHPVDRAALTADVNRMMERYIDVAMENVHIGKAIGDLLELVRCHGLRLPGNLAQLFKALAMCEGLLEQIDPDSSLNDYLEPMAGKLVYERFAGDQWAERLRDSAADAGELSIELPRRIDRVLGEVERGNLRVWTRVQDLDSALARFEHVVERANATILAAACIVAIAIVMLYYHPTAWERWIGIIFWIAVFAAIVHVVRTLLALRK